jgi:predicted ATPase
MTLQSHLDMMTGAGLITRAGTRQDDIDYLFRHALLHEAAYESLLRQERQQIHLAVGQALERAYPNRLAELAGRLADHFEQGHDWPRALTYYRQAGKAAMERFALEEAINAFSRALALAAQTGDQLTELDLCGLRGKVHDTRGAFDEARAITRPRSRCCEVLIWRRLERYFHPASPPWPRLTAAMPAR